MKFEYDSNKSTINKAKHGISFEEIQALWLEPYEIIDARAQDEARFMAVGKVQGKFYSCIYTIKGEAVRIISARRSRHLEEQRYYESQ